MLADIPQAKWGSGTGRQVILKSDFDRIEDAIVEGFELAQGPDLDYQDSARVRLNATSDCRARVMLCGFPSPLHRGLFVSGGLTDGKYRENSSPVYLDFASPATFWGSEKARQWYCVYAVAGSGEAGFTLKAMPVMRVASQSAQVINLRNNANDAGIGYGLVSNELANARILMLSGGARGLSRIVVANNSDNDSTGTLTYSGSGLTLNPGDWFIVLPATNFRYLGMVFNDGSSNLVPFRKAGPRVEWLTHQVIMSGALDGYVAVNLGLQVPPVARRLQGVAVATNGYDVKLAVSGDGVNPAVVVHAQPPATNFQGVRGGIPFTCLILDGGVIYCTNENTANQEIWALGWEE